MAQIDDNKVVWKEIDDTKQESPEVITKQKLFFLECEDRKGNIIDDIYIKWAIDNTINTKEFIEKYKKAKADAEKVVWNFQK